MTVPRRDHGYIKDLILRKAVSLVVPGCEPIDTFLAIAVVTAQQASVIK